MLALKAVIETYQGTLTVSEKRIAQVLLAQPAEAALLSAADLSARARVHQATAVRFAQKLGYQGYPELRAQLQADLIRPGPAARLQQRLEQSQGGILSTLIGSEVEALQALPTYVSQAQLDHAASLLVASKRIFLFSQGHASSLADLLDRRLRRSGFQTIVLGGSRRNVAEHLLTLSPDDTLLAFAFHREPEGLVQLLSHTLEVGASTILISDLLGSVVRPQPHLVLAAPRGEDEGFQTLLVPMAICNALVLTIATLDKDQSVEALERLAGLLAHFEYAPPATPDGDPDAQTPRSPPPA